MVQLYIWMGTVVKSSNGLVLSKAMKVKAPIMIRAAVSPMARDTARIMPVIMPGIAPGSTWFHTVCQWLGGRPPGAPPRRGGARGGDPPGAAAGGRGAKGAGR